MEFKKRLKEANIKQWEIAKVIGVSEFTLVRKLRNEPTGEFLEQLEEAITTILERRGLE